MYKMEDVPLINIQILDSVCLFFEAGIDRYLQLQKPVWFAWAVVKVKVLQNSLPFLPQADFVMLSLFLSLLTVSGKDHEWSAFPLQSQKRKENTIRAGASSQAPISLGRTILRYCLKCNHLLYRKAMLNSEQLLNNTE